MLRLEISSKPIILLIHAGWVPPTVEFEKPREDGVSVLEVEPFVLGDGVEDDAGVGLVDIRIDE